MNGAVAVIVFQVRRFPDGHRLDFLHNIQRPAVTHGHGQTHILQGRIGGSAVAAEVDGIIDHVHGEGVYGRRIRGYATNRGKLAGAVADIGTAGIARAQGSVGIVRLNANAAAEADSQGGDSISAVAFRGKLEQVGTGAGHLRIVGATEHQAGVTCEIPIPDDLGNIPGVVGIIILNPAKVFHDGVVVGLICPGKGSFLPRSKDFMHAYRETRGGCRDMIELEGSFHNNIVIRKLRKLQKSHKAAHGAVGGGSAHIQQGGGDRTGLADGKILHIVPGSICIYYRVEHHGILAVCIRHPALGQGICKGVYAPGAGKAYGYITIDLSRRVPKVRGRHNHNHGFLVGTQQHDLVAFRKHRQQAAGVEGILVALQTGIVTANHDGFLHLIGYQIVDHIGIGKYIVVAQLRMVLFQNGLGILGFFPLGRQVQSLHLGSSFADCHDRRAFLTDDPEGRPAHLAGHKETEGIAVFFNGNGIGAAEGLGEGDIPHASGVAVAGGGGNQGIVDLFPLAILSVMNAFAIHRRHVQAVGKAEFLGILRAFLRNLLDDVGFFGSRRGLFLLLGLRLGGNGIRFGGKCIGRHHLHQQSQYKNYAQAADIAGYLHFSSLLFGI